MFNRVVKLKSTLPKGSPNGLADLGDLLAKDPLTQRVAIVLFDVERNSQRHHAEVEEVVVQINRIEVVLDGDEGFDLREKLRTLYGNRTGERELPPDLIEA